jgi:glycosyltransferase involved in cell wall biosynthesis
VRVVLLHQYFNTPSMSGATRSYEMGRRLVGLGHAVDIVTSLREGRAGRGRWTVTDEDGITVHWLPVPYSNRMDPRARIKAFLRFALAAAHRAARVPSDVVLATSTPLTIALPGVYAAWRQRIPMVFEVRDLWPELPIAVGVLGNPVVVAAARRFERFAYRNARRVVALSPEMRDGIVRTGYPPDRVAVIPNSCDRDQFAVRPGTGRRFRERHTWLGDRPLVLYAGALGAINGVGYLARVAEAAIPLDEEVRFLVVGTGSEVERVRAEARRLGVLDVNFRILPAMPKADIPEVLAAATMATSLFVDIREMWANSANKFFDALAAGTPVAINYGGWQSELIDAHAAGLVLPAHDTDAAAEQIVRAVRNPAWLKRAEQGARALARRFDRDLLAGELERVLLDAIGEPHGRRAGAGGAPLRR